MKSTNSTKISNLNIILRRINFVTKLSFNDNTKTKRYFNYKTTQMKRFAISLLHYHRSVQSVQPASRQRLADCTGRYRIKFNYNFTAINTSTIQ